MTEDEIRSLAMLLKPHAEQVLRIWEAEGVAPPRPQARRRVTRKLTADGFEVGSNYAEIVAKWDAWATRVESQSDRSAAEAEACRNFGRALARGAKETDDKTPRQAALDAQRPGSPSVEELERQITARRDDEAHYRAAMAWRPDGGPSINHLVNSFRMQLHLPPGDPSGPPDTSPPTG